VRLPRGGGRRRGVADAGAQFTARRPQIHARERKARAPAQEGRAATTANRRKAKEEIFKKPKLGPYGTVIRRLRPDFMMNKPREVEVLRLQRYMLGAVVPATRHYDPALSRQPGATLSSDGRLTTMSVRSKATRNSTSGLANRRNSWFCRSSITISTRANGSTNRRGWPANGSSGF
jgi:hypothetical protein